MRNQQIEWLIQLALHEDLGRGDCTSNLIVDEKINATAAVIVKQPCRLAGLHLIADVFAEVDPSVQVTPLIAEGSDVSTATAVCRLEGNARSILAGERTALNFLGRLSGVATKTREAVARIDGTRAKLLDTRKTTPGWRELEKYAVRVGGGYNHRFGLDDMILIKDNHIALAGGVGNAIARARTGAALSQKIEVEVDTLDQLREVLEFAVDLILLDNMDLGQLAEAVWMTKGRTPLEASGNMTPERLLAVASTGVDYISMGALTHSAVSIDVGLDIC